MKTYAIAAIPGDGIGPEVVDAGVEVLEAVAKRDGGFALKVDRFDWGGDYYKKHGRMMPENGRDQIGRTVRASDTSTLQTSAGRLVFARPA